MVPPLDPSFVRWVKNTIPDVEVSLPWENDELIRPVGEICDLHGGSMLHAMEKGRANYDVSVNVSHKPTPPGAR